MTPEQWQEVKQIVEFARELDPTSRDGFLDKYCPDAELRAEVESLLAADASEGHFLDPPVTLDSQVSRLEDESIPDRVGDYRILQKIGEGGMGTVYVAEQQRPIRRTVALKIIKWGMDSKEVLARFEAERQALAMMDHPNVAKVLDAGATPQGRPYFVMELIRGESLIEYCDKQRLSMRERLRLFIQVCEGVQHAHHKGIIHRDIKPANILVQLQGDEAVPKIIDFGVARATAQRLTERTVFTEFGNLIGTPDYMSPEQAEMTVQDIDTRTDIYSLGVVLYELLAGALPFDSQSLREGGFDEIRRRIREKEPPKPSVRVSSLGEATQESARRRNTDRRQLVRALRGDLDWVVLKALEKDRTRRYSSASDFAEDLQLFLVDQPVSAGPPGSWYRLRKFLVRNRVVVGVLSLIGVALMVTVTTTLENRLEVASLRSASKALSVPYSLWILEDEPFSPVLLDKLTPDTIRVLRSLERSERHGFSLAVGLSVLLNENPEHWRSGRIRDGTDRLLEIAEDSAVILVFAANAYQLLGEYEQAIACLERALELSQEQLTEEFFFADNIGEVELKMATLLRLVGDLEGSSTYYERAKQRGEGSREEECLLALERDGPNSHSKICDEALQEGAGLWLAEYWVRRGFMRTAYSILWSWPYWEMDELLALWHEPGFDRLRGEREFELLTLEAEAELQDNVEGRSHNAPFKVTAVEGPTVARYDDPSHSTLRVRFSGQPRFPVVVKLQLNCSWYECPPAQIFENSEDDWLVVSERWHTCGQPHSAELSETNLLSRRTSTHQWIENDGSWEYRRLWKGMVVDSLPDEQMNIKVYIVDSNGDFDTAELEVSCELPKLEITSPSTVTIQSGEDPLDWSFRITPNAVAPLLLQMENARCPSQVGCRTGVSYLFREIPESGQLVADKAWLCPPGPKDRTMRYRVVLSDLVGNRTERDMEILCLAN